MTKRKILIVISARASYSRIKTALLALLRKNKINLKVILVASSSISFYGNTRRQLEIDGVSIDQCFETLSEHKDFYGQLDTLCTSMQAIGKYILANNFDAIFTIADRYETIATAISAVCFNIPLIHLQGGEVTGNIDEKVRHAVTKLANIHLVCTKIARDNVIRMGEYPCNVFITGCPSCDLAEYASKSNISPSEILPRYECIGIDKPTGCNPYYIVLQHPVTDEYEDVSRQITETIKAVENMKHDVIWIANNADAGADKVYSAVSTFVKSKKKQNVWLYNGIDSSDFLSLLIGSVCILGNSSVGIRECSYLGVPAVNIGSRQSGRERGKNVIDVAHDWMEILNAVNSCVKMPRCKDNLYGDGNAGEVIADILENIQLNHIKKLVFSQ